ncbi:hypothetical protein EDB81DRAFT_295935 [Dactylonectria macrodidyma]|uniref:Uncharacterized protein n=1 Tax=Dactylonectria macrodidyma TaxID=307937 RepID=A0A9P9D936_9HYPO|nr:hypothetical protein EDB81DRAFT_295935 [Dactylonectria macrodidyma]
MKRRFRTTEERTEALRKAIDFLETDLRRTQAIRGFGRGYLWNYVRQKAGILISQNRLYDFYRDVFPEEVQKRREGNFKHRTDFSVPGPNFLFLWASLSSNMRYHRTRKRENDHRKREERKEGMKVRNCKRKDF